jgi:uroporphyrinogen decarboxylase
VSKKRFGGRSKIRLRVAHSWAVGTERLLVAMVEEPEWCVDMFNHFLDVNIALLEQETAQADFWQDQKKAQETMRHISQLKEVVATWRNLEKSVADSKY